MLTAHRLVEAQKKLTAAASERVRVEREVVARVRKQRDAAEALMVKSFTAPQYHRGLKAVGLDRPEGLGQSLPTLCNHLLPLCDPDMIPNQQKLLETMAVSLGSN